MTNQEFFVRTILQGRKTGETPEDFNVRLVKAASDVIAINTLDQESNSLAGGVDTSIPVDVSSPGVTDEIIIDDLKRHAAEIEAVKKANKMLIDGIAAAVLAVVAASTGGASSLTALAPLLQQLMTTYFTK